MAKKTPDKTAAEIVAHEYATKKAEILAKKKIESDAALEIDDSFEKVSGVDPSLQFTPLKPDGQTHDSRLRDVIDGMMSTKGMEVRSVLTSKHEIALIRISMFGEKYDSPLAKFLYSHLLELRVSHDGQGRKDLVAAMKAAVSHDRPQNDMLEAERRRRFFR